MTPVPAHRSRLGLTLAACCVTQAMILLDITIVNVALPDIERDLNSTPGGLEWVINAYTLALAGLILVGGSLGDRFGRKRFLLTGIAAFTAASMACALSRTDTHLIIFRAVQGIGGAMMAALTLSILVDACPPHRRTQMIGLWAAIGGLGFGLGPVLGGLLLGVFPWSSIFWVNVLIGGVGFTLARIGITESKAPARHPIDWPGAILVSGALLFLTLGLIESNDTPWASAPVAGSLTAAVLLAALFGLREHRTEHPMVPLALFRLRNFAGANTIVALLYVSLSGMLFFVTLLFQNLLGWSALTTGLSWLFLNGPFMLAALNAGRLDRHFNVALIIGVGCSLGALSLLLLAFVGPDTPFAVTALAYAANGLAYGLAVPAASSAGMAGVSPDHRGVGSGILNTSRQIGSTIGLALVAAIGVGVTTRRWESSTAASPAGPIPDAAASTSAVTSGEAGTVSDTLGTAAGRLAEQAFLSGYRAALFATAIALAVAALLAAFTLNRDGGRRRTI